MTTDEKQAEDTLKEEVKAADDLADVRVHEDHTRELRTPGFTRMRTDWHGSDSAQIAALASMVDNIILQEFADAFLIMNEVYEIVREPVVDPITGEVEVDRHGWTVWARTDDGGFVEDFSRLGVREREDLLFKITTRMFEWKQKQADLWGEAMFSKAIWEERFSHGFVHAVGTRPTVDDKTNQARSYATDERYFSIFRTLISRRADAVVSGCELLGQRLKDVLTL